MLSRAKNTMHKFRPSLLKLLMTNQNTYNAKNSSGLPALMDYWAVYRIHGHQFSILLFICPKFYQRGSIASAGIAIAEDVAALYKLTKFECSTVQLYRVVYNWCANAAT